LSEGLIPEMQTPDESGAQILPSHHHIEKVEQPTNLSRAGSDRSLLFINTAAYRRGRDIIAHQVKGKFGAKPQCSPNGGSPSANPIETGVCEPDKADRPWRQVAGPALSPVELRLATIPIDKTTAARVDRNNRDYAGDDRSTLIKRSHPPINVQGGHKWAGTPSVYPEGVGAP
jgi:hypothetical protein